MTPRDEAEGKPVWVGYIHSLERYQTMMKQAEAEITRYNEQARGLISAEMANAAGMGAEQAQELLALTFPDTPASELWTQIDRQAAVNAAAVTARGAPLEVLFQKSFPDTKQGLETALITGIGAGLGWKWVAVRMKEAADMPFPRAERIARTEINRALRNAAFQQYQASPVFTGYRRMCYPPTACLACLALDGEYSPMSEGVLSDHPNGKCSMIPWRDPNKPPDWQTGRQWLMEQTEEDQRRIMGAGRFELWKRGQVRDLLAFSEIKPNETWGGSPHVIPIKYLSYTEAPADINIENGGFQYIGDLRNLSGIYSSKDLGAPYAVPKPVIYNEYAANHIKNDHPERIEWLKENQAAIIRAVTDPEFIEKETRYKDRIGRYSVTAIAKTDAPESAKNQYIAVAITLSNDLEPGGYHQITTVHPVRKSHVLKADGTPKDGMIKIK